MYAAVVKWFICGKEALVARASCISVFPKNFALHDRLSNLHKLLTSHSLFHHFESLVWQCASSSLILTTSPLNSSSLPTKLPFYFYSHPSLPASGSQPVMTQWSSATWASIRPTDPRNNCIEPPIKIHSYLGENPAILDSNRFRLMPSSLRHQVQDSRGVAPFPATGGWDKR